MAWEEEVRMAVTFQNDPVRRRTLVTVPPGTRWATFETAFIRAISEQPEIADWNLIIDDEGPIDDVSVDGMVRLGEVFRRLSREPERDTFTVAVTRDRFFGPWAQVIDANYGRRKHHAASTPDAAARLLDRLEAGAGRPR